MKNKNGITSLFLLVSFIVAALVALDLFEHWDLTKVSEQWVRCGFVLVAAFVAAATVGMWFAGAKPDGEYSSSSKRSISPLVFVASKLIELIVVGLAGFLALVSVGFVFHLLFEGQPIKQDDKITSLIISIWSILICLRIFFSGKKLTAEAET